MAQPPLRRGRHSISRLVVHLVFVVKYRRKALSGAALDRMHRVFLGVAEKMGFQLMELNGEADHGHLLVEYPPTILVSTLLNHLKGVSTRMLRKEFPELAARGAHLWRPTSYFAASAGGAPIERLREYVEAQEKPS
jgi:putative transposase